MDITPTDPLNNDNSVRDTIALMSGHASNASNSWQVKQALDNAGANDPRLSEEECIQRIFDFIHSNVRFVEDPTQLANMFQQPGNKELLITPQVLISMDNPMGDCDDFSMLSCAMLMAKGIRCDFVTIAANRSQPSEFSHVYCQVTAKDGTVIPFDSSHGGYPGWETGSIYRKQVWPVLNWKGKGLGAMTVGQQTKRTPGKIWASQFHQGLMGLALGDEGDTGNSGDITVGQAIASGIDTGVDPGYSPTSGSIPILSTSNPSQVNWNNILPGLFQAVDKIAIQTTQPAGISSQTCNAAGVCSSTQTVLPTGASSLAIPGLTSSSLGSMLPLLLIAVAVFAFAEK